MARSSFFLLLLQSILAVGGASPGSLAAQDVPVFGEAVVRVVLEDRPVGHGLTDVPHVEPSLASAPGGGDTLLGGAIVVSPVRGSEPWHCVVLRTEVGGRTWERHDLPMEGCVDPWIVFPDDESALFAGIEILEDGEGRNRLHLVVFRSEDGGKTWPDEPLSLGRRFDHHLLEVERDRGSPEGTIHLVAQRAGSQEDEGAGVHIAVLRSRDGGRTFQPVTEIRPSSLPLRPTGLEILSDGTMVVTFQDRLPDDREEEGSRRTWALVSTDGGEHFSEPHFITEACGPSPGFSGYPFLAVDTSAGPYRDRLYHACIREGFDGVAVTTSTDAGRSWGDPLRVDGLGAEAEEGHARTPMVAVDGNGAVGVAWYDRRLDPERRCQDVFFTASVDGGQTFSEPRRISTETSCPGVPGNGRTAESWPMGGDYSSIVGLPEGGFHLLWADSRSGVFQIRQARLEVGGIDAGRDE